MNTEANQKGYDDGYNLRPENNPYEKDSVEFLDYEMGWDDGILYRATVDNLGVAPENYREWRQYKPQAADRRAA